MPSPFPGMNPYLERAEGWQDFHHSFMPIARVALAEQLRPRYHVRIEENVYVHDLTEDERVLLGRPDLFIRTHHRPSGGDAGAATAAVVTTAPAYGYVPPTTEALREGFLAVVDQESRKVVTVLELLSPSNKLRADDRAQYEAKRRSLLHGDVNFVEIDLLRAGARLPIDGLPQCDYYAMVSRVEERPTVALWPILLEQRLPMIPIPVRPGDPDAWLDLQQLLNRAYDDAGYEDYIYERPPAPPLHPAKLEWARQFIPSPRAS